MKLVGIHRLVGALQQRLDVIVVVCDNRADTDGECRFKALGRLMQLPDETVVLPGHMAETTIGRERQSNPFILQELRRLRGE